MENSDRSEVTSHSFLKEIHRIEDQRMDLILQGAEVRPDLRMRFELLGLKLDRYYRWYAQALMAGKV